MPKTKRIALLLPQDIGYCRAVLRGVQEYAAATNEWVFRDAPPVPDVLPALRGWKPHGIIALLYDAELATALRRMHKPLVNTTSTLDLPKVPLVENDHEAIGRLAAEHYLKRGYRHFGYFGSQWMGASLAREAAFRQAIEAAGFSVSTCHGDYLPRPAPSDSWAQVDRRIDAWLRGLSKPVAVFAQNDVPARDLADRCRGLGLNVPHQVALMGVDNDELECHLCRPPLSSVAVPGRQIGIQAARTLDGLLAGTRPDPLHRYLPPVAVVTRQSTDTLAIDDELVAEVLRSIHQETTAGLNITQIVRRLNVSRRRVERRFRDQLGVSPLEELRRVRVQRAKQLLVETDLDMPAVAKNSGFADARRLSVVFKQQTGQSPRQFRRELRGLGGGSAADDLS